MSAEPRPLTDEAELAAALEVPTAVIYKHSPLCGRSIRARREIEAFMAARPDVPVFQVDVIRSRPLSRHVAERLDVHHESPQALLLRDGRVAWHGAHGSVTAAALETALG